MLITEVLYTPASTTIKLSILLLYRRLFPNRSLKITSICVAPFLLVFALAQMLSVIIQCSPPAALWDPASYPNAQCDKYAPALLLFAIVNALTDVFILSLPLPILWHLQVSAHQRWRLISVFLLGGLYERPFPDMSSHLLMYDFQGMRRKHLQSWLRDASLLD